MSQSPIVLLKAKLCHTVGYSSEFLVLFKDEGL